MRKLYFLAVILFSINASSQIISPNGDNIFYYNGAADVIFKYPPRGSGGRAFVHADGNTLSLNFGSDFSGGTRIGNDVYFKDGGNSYIYSGNFGIGTSSPLTKLDVRGNISVWGQNSSNTEDHGQIFFENSNHGVRRIGNIVDIFTSGGDESGITFTPRSYNSSTNSYSNMLAAMKISANGNIGIGTNNPTKKLEIFSNSTTALKIATTYPNTNTTEIHLGGSADFTKSAIISAPNAAGWYRQDLFFCLANGNNTSSVELSDAAMVIKSYDSGKFGNVGIGTINPDEKLTVKGKIHTQEVRVDLLGPLVPDYVFAKDYKLKSLQEIEDYIKQNSHLPEIPSAKEIEKNGLMLAEMNMSLLKKIEELTLYSIEQNKKTEAQAKEIEAQSKEIETLKDLVLRVTNIEKELAKK